MEADRETATSSRINSLVFLGSAFFGILNSTALSSNYIIRW